MNLLELQVLAVVSRIPGGNDAASPDFDVESDLARANTPLQVIDNNGSSMAADDCSVTQPA